MYVGYNITPESFKENPLLAYHRVVEAFKFSYGQRLHLGDSDFNETVREVSCLLPNTCYGNVPITQTNHHAVEWLEPIIK